MNVTRVFAPLLVTAIVLAPAACPAAATDFGAAAESAVATPGSEIPAGSDGSDAGFAWSATYASRYSFQGIDYSNGRPVLQPSASASFRGLTAGCWGNVDQAQRRLNEVDLTIQHEVGRGPASGALGYAHLRYPNRPGWAPTHEAYLDVALKAPLAPMLSVHWDLDAGSGRYWTLGLGQEFGLSSAPIALAAKLFVHEHYYGMSGVPSLETALSLTASWGPFEFEPAIARQWAWENGDFRDDLAVRPGWLVSVAVAPR